MSKPTRTAKVASWRKRHAAVCVLALVLTYLFTELRADWSAMHKWNRAVGDASLLLITVAMTIGPVARLGARFRGFVPWRRELGIWGTLLAIAHTVIILVGWVEWDLIRLFGYEWHPVLQRYVMLLHGFGLANAIGIAALLYACVLALTSNDVSQRFLGGAAWKFLQQGAYVLWALLVLHTAYFLYLHFQDFHRKVPDTNIIQVPFAILVLSVAALQGGAFWLTWRKRRVGNG